MDPTTPPIKLNDVDRAVLREIVENGRAPTGILSDEVGKSGTYIRQRVGRLVEHDLLARRYDTYELTNTGERVARGLVNSDPTAITAE